VSRFDRPDGIVNFGNEADTMKQSANAHPAEQMQGFHRPDASRSPTRA
jgi:hypothetical protein